MEHDLIDEYRLLVFPIAIGEGRRLFGDGIASIDMHLVSAVLVGAAVLLVYSRELRTEAGSPAARLAQGDGHP